MKRFSMLLTGVALMASTAGCAAIHDSFRAVEDAVKAPPQAVIDAVRLGADFILGLINTFLHGALSGVLSGFFSGLGI